MNCLVCYSNKTNLKFLARNNHGRKILSDEKFQIYYCNNCQAYFIANLKESEEYYQRYYLSDYYKEETNSLTDRILHRLKIFSINQKQNFILKNVPKSQSKISILDLGCGDGSFLEYLDPRVFEKEGIDVSQKSVDICRSKGIKTFKGTIFDYPEKKKFDVITLWHVAEHLFNPSETITVAKKYLKKDGLLIIGVPNTNSFGFKVAQENWFHFDSPRHTFLPNNQTICYLAQNNGLKIHQEINEFYDFPLDLFWSLAFSKYKFLLIFYPILKIISSETRTYILINNKS
jgi:2-polyprenyl-3-methyl-5-hydroxy-6-metoxy-1,4-benzoquinol methylase